MGAICSRPADEIAEEQARVLRRKKGVAGSREGITTLSSKLPS